eukprot:m.15335 g.15335  ORF g.15335 m.15335 type:complete len:58 (+) comp26314_c0_seq1:92-265(+)
MTALMAGANQSQLAVVLKDATPKVLSLLATPWIGFSEDDSLMMAHSLMMSFCKMHVS